jgi:small neutral amino acid transporter SnatA (MarC family)
VRGAGITALVTIWAGFRDLNLDLILIGMTTAVFAFAYLVLHRLSRSGRTVNSERMLIVAKVFVCLLAALAVELALKGLDDLGLIHVEAH